MKPQSAQRKTLCSQKEFSFKEKTEQMPSVLDRAKAQRQREGKTELKKQWLKEQVWLNKFNVENLKAGKNDQQI